MKCNKKVSEKCTEQTKVLFSLSHTLQLLSNGLNKLKVTTIVSFEPLLTRLTTLQCKMQKRDLWRETLSYVNSVLYKDKLFYSQDMIKVQMINEMRTHISKNDFHGIKVALLISIHV